MLGAEVGVRDMRYQGCLKLEAWMCISGGLS